MRHSLGGKKALINSDFDDSGRRIHPPHEPRAVESQYGKNAVPVFHVA